MAWFSFLGTCILLSVPVSSDSWLDPLRTAPPVPAGCTAESMSWPASPVTTIPMSGTITETITVSGMTGTIWDVDVITDIEHGFNEDLIISLTHISSGTIVILGSRNGGGTRDIYSGTIWDDSSEVLVKNYFTNMVAAPDLNPEGALGSLIGLDPNGDWQLTIEDVDPAHGTGTLQSWQLNITTIDQVPDSETFEMTRLPGQNFSDTSPLTDTLSFSGLSDVICDVTLYTEITHGQPADIDMVLRYQGAIDRTVSISTDNGGGMDDVFNGTTWSDRLGFGFEVTDYPFPGGIVPELVPEGALSAFIGLDPNVSWTLDIVDDRAGEDGHLAEWGLSITTCTCSSNQAPTGAVIGLTTPINTTSPAVVPRVQDPDIGDIHRITPGSPVPVFGTVTVVPGGSGSSDALQLQAGPLPGRETFSFTVTDSSGAEGPGLGTLIVLPEEWLLIADAWYQTTVLDLINLVNAPDTYQNSLPIANDDRLFSPAVRPRSLIPWPMTGTPIRSTPSPSTKSPHSHNRGQPP